MHALSPISHSNADFFFQEPNICCSSRIYLAVLVQLSSSVSCRLITSTCSLKVSNQVVSNFSVSFSLFFSFLISLPTFFTSYFPFSFLFYLSIRLKRKLMSLRTIQWIIPWKFWRQRKSCFSFVVIKHCGSTGFSPRSKSLSVHLQKGLR